MWGAASFLFRCARCSCTPVWVRGSRSSRQCPYRVAVPPEGGGAPPALGGRRAAPVAPQLRWVRGGGWGGRPPARSRACVGGGGEWGGPFGPLAMPPVGQGGGMAVLAPGYSPPPTGDRLSHNLCRVPFRRKPGRVHRAVGIFLSVYLFVYFGVHLLQCYIHLSACFSA